MGSGFGRPASRTMFVSTTSRCPMSSSRTCSRTILPAAADLIPSVRMFGPWSMPPQSGLLSTSGEPGVLDSDPLRSGNSCGAPRPKRRRKRRSRPPDKSPNWSPSADSQTTTASGWDAQRRRWLACAFAQSTALPGAEWRLRIRSSCSSLSIRCNAGQCEQSCGTECYISRSLHHKSHHSSV